MGPASFHCLYIQRLTDDRTARQPREMVSRNEPPEFAFFVCKYLPPMEWYRGYTLKNRDIPLTTLTPGPLVSWFDLYHYEKLQEVEEVDKVLLKRSFNLWCYWGEFEGGEPQRNTLACLYMAWAKSLAFYEEIQKGVNGTEEQKKAFEEKWKAIGMVEAGRDTDWEIWEKLQYHNDETPEEPVRDLWVYLNPNRKADDFLGRRLYAKKYREKVEGVISISYKRGKWTS
jgi:hypothetical protein